ncbi:MAG: beta-N-acetylhexosaminidase [Propionibacteriaceae bacterium]|nr:beta-N-acetylhexosaminidase [Propionibacteriaceae bacterium]
MSALIPRPNFVAWGDGQFTLTDQTPVGCAPDASPEALAAARGVRRVLSATTGLLLPEGPGGLAVALDPNLPAEGYRLDVRPDGVTLTAADYRGAQWGAQTLLQLAPADVYAVPLGRPVPLTAAHIEDAPRFPRRGAMLDSARHFVRLAEVLDFVDWLARHKLNVFHWHLSDDQGWRVAVDKYPLLALKASWRAKTSNRVWGDDGTPHGGYYTLAQLRAVADYARERGVEIVPEIDFPGHATAVLFAYPQFATDPSAATEVAHYPTIFDNVLNFSPEALDFVHDIWAEVIAATGARHVHIGGDEVPTTHWEASPEVTERARDLGVADVRSIQRWFTLHLRDWLTAQGVTPIGWDEVIDEGPVPGMVCQAWRGAEYGVKAAGQGMDVVMSPTSHTYFDFYQSELREEPYGQGDVTTLEKAYGFDPLDGVTPEAAERVLGTQFQLWSEFLPTYRAVQYAAWPRGCALAEVAWSAAGDRDFADFSSRLTGHLERLDAAGVNYRPLDGPRPWQTGGTGWRRRPPED